MRGKFTEILGTRGQSMAIPMTATTPALGAANTTVTVTLNPEDDMSVLFFGFSAYYDQPTARAVLTVTDGTTVARYMVNGEEHFESENPTQFAPGATVTATLAAVSGAIGSLTTFHAISSGKGG